MTSRNDIPQTPNTISDKKWAELQERARKADSRSMFDPAVVKQRKQSIDQAQKRKWS